MPMAVPKFVLRKLVCVQRSAHKKTEVPVVKAARKIPGAAPHIPDCFRLKPSEQDLKLQQQKEKLLQKLKPTEDSVSQVRCCCHILQMCPVILC
jgi:hypothetical protein